MVCLLRGSYPRNNDRAIFEGVKLDICVYKDVYKDNIRRESL